MQRKRIKSISETGNHYNTFQEAINGFLKFKTAQGMSELIMKDYTNTFNRFMRVSSNTMSMDTLKKASPLQNIVKRNTRVKRLFR